MNDRYHFRVYEHERRTFLFFRNPLGRADVLRDERGRPATFRDGTDALCAYLTCSRADGIPLEVAELALRDNLGPVGGRSYAEALDRRFRFG